MGSRNKLIHLVRNRVPVLNPCSWKNTWKRLPRINLVFFSYPVILLKNNSHSIFLNISEILRSSIDCFFLPCNFFCRWRLPGTSNHGAQTGANSLGTNCPGSNGPGRFPPLTNGAASPALALHEYLLRSNRVAASPPTANALRNKSEYGETHDKNGRTTGRCDAPGLAE